MILYKRHLLYQWNKDTLYPLNVTQWKLHQRNVIPCNEMLHQYIVTPTKCYTNEMSHHWNVSPMKCDTNKMLHQWKLHQ